MVIARPFIVRYFAEGLFFQILNALPREVLLWLPPTCYTRYSILREVKLKTDTCVRNSPSPGEAPLSRGEWGSTRREISAAAMARTGSCPVVLTCVVVVAVPSNRRDTFGFCLCWHKVTIGCDGGNNCGSQRSLRGRKRDWGYLWTRAKFWRKKKDGVY